MALLHLIFTPNQTDGVAADWNMAGGCGRRKEKWEHVSHQQSNSPHAGQIFNMVLLTTGGRADSEVLPRAQKAECWKYLVNSSWEGFEGWVGIRWVSVDWGLVARVEGQRWSWALKRYRESGMGETEAEMCKQLGEGIVSLPVWLEEFDWAV